MTMDITEASEYKCPTCGGFMKKVTRPVNHQVHQCTNCDAEFGSGYLEGWKDARCQLEKIIYTRPEATTEDKALAKKAAETLLKKYGLRNFGTMLAHLCLENVMLVREINEHREARGIEPIKVTEV